TARQTVNAVTRKDFTKKLKRIKDTDERVIRNKLYSFMASKGYSYKITGELIEEFVNNNNYDKNY
ncbi:MAG: RecX family transcriptional regulator, partial [Lachnospiraceae bacterium]|nr:RecX family transcriptional regulator [Lachnospiraceae bacterium]